MLSEERGLLERIAARLDSFEEKVERRLDSLEQKVERIVVPPQALKPRDAAKVLGASVKTVKAMIRSGALHTVEIGEREHVPMSELVRITMVAPDRKRTGPALLPKPTRLGRGTPKGRR